MAQKNRKCLACGTKYSYCPDCSRADKLAPTWKAEFCSEPCMTLWTTLTKFGMSRLSKSEAKEIISALDLKSIESYVACVKRDYEKVMAEEKRSRRAYKPVIEQVETTVVEEVPAVVVESHEVVLQENE